MATFNILEPSAAIKTTDATPTPVVLIDLPPDSSANVKVSVLGRRASNGNCRAWQKACCVKRVGTGNAQLLGSLLDVVPDQGDGPATLGVSVDGLGDQVRVLVTGAAGIEIDWYAEANAVIITGD